MFEMFNWSMPNKVQEIIPVELREPFEKTFIEPLRRQKRDGQIAEQLLVPVAIERIEEQLKELAPKEEAAKTKRVQIERMIADAQPDLTAAKEDERSLHWLAWDLRQQIESLKARQAQYGSVLLTEFKFEMMGEWEKLRNAGRDEFREGKKNLLTGKTKNSVWTNRPAVEKEISYRRAAMVEAEAMRSMPLTDAEVLARLDTLRKEIPAMGDWTMVDVKQTIFIDKGYERYGGEISLPPNY